MQSDFTLERRWIPLCAFGGPTAQVASGAECITGTGDNETTDVIISSAASNAARSESSMLSLKAFFFSGRFSLATMTRPTVLTSRSDIIFPQFDMDTPPVQNHTRCPLRYCSA
ncbi:hypothetical protein ACFQD2_01595 [Pseudomonas lini]